MVPLAAFVVVIAGAMFAASIITPMLLALFISIICVQPILWLFKRKVNHTLAVLIVLVGVIAIFVGFGAVLGNSINSFAKDAPLYANKLRDIVDGVVQYVPRGQPQLIKRKYVEVLARSRKVNLSASGVKLADGETKNTVISHNGVNYPFQVLHDPSPKGGPWLQKILSEN